MVYHEITLSRWSSWARNNRSKHSLCLAGSNSSNDHRSSKLNGGASASKSHDSVNGYICNDCSFHSQKTDSPITQSSSSSLSSKAAGASSEGLFSSSTSSPFTSIYSRDRSQRKKTGKKPLSGERSYLKWVLPSYSDNLLELESEMVGASRWWECNR